MAAGFPDAALTHAVSTEWCSGTPVTTWYLGLINNSPGPTFAAGDTLGGGGHSGWVEAIPGTAYTGNRKPWTNGAAAAKATTNASVVAFAMLATITVYGAFLCDQATGTSGILGPTAAFTGGTQSFSSGDTCQVTFTISAASG